VFARYGWQNPKVFLNEEDFSIEYSWSVGFQIAGSLWGREEDCFGIAYGQIKPSGDYKEVNLGLSAEKEGHLELYYNIKLNKYLSISPIAQVVWNPYGRDALGGAHTIVIGGIRSQVDF
jgi:carbohydrate-selective porin OprB